VKGGKIDGEEYETRLKFSPPHTRD